MAMNLTELDAFLREERTCRVATVGRDGRPHNVPLWFVWDGSALWLSSIVHSQRWADVARDPRASIVVDGGFDYAELRGAELIGILTQVGDVPRSDLPDPRLEAAERLWARKYAGAEHFTPDGRHAWLRLIPDKIVSWDHRKLGL
jgi:hypothetical protein